MATVCGFVEKIKFRNEDNGYTVLSLTSEGKEYTLVGSFHYISEGEMMEASGTMTEHPVYGEQMNVESYEIKAPEDTTSMERYLGSGAIKGVGAVIACSPFPLWVVRSLPSRPRLTLFMVKDGKPENKVKFHRFEGKKLSALYNIQ